MLEIKTENLTQTFLTVGCVTFVVTVETAAKKLVFVGCASVKRSFMKDVLATLTPMLNFFEVGFAISALAKFALGRLLEHKDCGGHLLVDTVMLERFDDFDSTLPNFLKGKRTDIL